MSGRRRQRSFPHNKWMPEEVDIIYRCLADAQLMANFDSEVFPCGQFPTVRVSSHITEGHAYFPLCKAIADQILEHAGEANANCMRPLHSIARKIQDMREFTLSCNESIEDPLVLYGAFDLMAFMEQPRTSSGAIVLRPPRQLPNPEDVSALMSADCPPPTRDGATITFQTRLLNPYLACTLCMGYFREACTIIECLHTFCKTCIRDHFRDSQHCPTCNKDLGGNPAELVRNDRTLQSIVDKVLAPDPDGLSGSKRPLEGAGLPLEKRLRTETGMGHISFSLHAEGESDVSALGRPFLRTDSTMTINHLRKYVLAKTHTTVPPDCALQILCHDQVLRADWTLACAYNECWNNPLQDMVLKYRMVKKETPTKTPVLAAAEADGDGDGDGARELDFMGVDADEKADEPDGPGAAAEDAPLDGTVTVHVNEETAADEQTVGDAEQAPKPATEGPSSS